MNPRVARTPVRAAAWAASAVIVVALLGACDEPRASRGRVEGVVRAGPTCPVQQQGQVCPPRAVDGEVQVLEDGEVVARARTNRTGAYELAVDAGDYVLAVDTGGQAFPLCPTMPVQVRVAATTTVDIDCDTGIR